MTEFQVRRICVTCNGTGDIRQLVRAATSTMSVPTGKKCPYCQDGYRHEWITLDELRDLLGPNPDR
jgi:hypothetical protein